MMLAGDSEENDEKIQAFRAAQLHTRQAQKFHEKANSLEELLNLQSLHANVHIMLVYFTLLQEEIHKLLGNAKEEEKLLSEQMESAAFEKVNGPLSVHLDEVLKKMNVKRQAYHGKSLIGNHVHICCKVTQILPLEKEIVESQNSIKLLRVSFLVGRQYHLTMQYCVYESADYLNNGKIDKLEEDIANFQFIREKFPDMMITPRLHTLEEHVCPFLQQ
nr:uncharacterized protein LOC131780576 [Pocillopora verrucosa]